MLGSWSHSLSLDNAWLKTSFPVSTTYSWQKCGHLPSIRSIEPKRWWFWRLRRNTYGPTFLFIELSTFPPVEVKANRELYALIFQRNLLALLSLGPSINCFKKWPHLFQKRQVDLTFKTTNAKPGIFYFLRPLVSFFIPQNYCTMLTFACWSSKTPTSIRNFCIQGVLWFTICAWNVQYMELRKVFMKFYQNVVLL